MPQLRGNEPILGLNRGGKTDVLEVERETSWRWKDRRPLAILSRCQNCIVQHHYGIECDCVSYETPNYSHEGERDHSVSQQNSH
jgi:hypothetical protein